MHTIAILSSFILKNISGLYATVNPFTFDFIYETWYATPVNLFILGIL